MTQLAEDLRAARGLIDTPEKWTGASILDVLFDATGSWYRGSHPRVLAMCAALDSLLDGSSKTGARPYIEYVESHTHADIMALFDRAILAAESQP